MFGRFFIIILGESLQYSLHKYTLKCINFQNKKKDGFFVFFLRMEKKIKAKSAVFIGKKPRTVTLFIPGLFDSYFHSGNKRRTFCIRLENGSCFVVGCSRFVDYRSS